MEFAAFPIEISSPTGFEPGPMLSVSLDLGISADQSPLSGSASVVPASPTSGQLWSSTFDGFELDDGLAALLDDPGLPLFKKPSATAAAAVAAAAAAAAVTAPPPAGRAFQFAPEVPESVLDSPVSSDASGSWGSESAGEGSADDEFGAVPLSVALPGSAAPALESDRREPQPRRSHSGRPMRATRAARAAAAREHRAAPVRQRQRQSPVPEYTGPLPESISELSDEQVAALSFRDFTKMCTKSKLTKAQVTEAKKTRRRIKNRHSARDCAERRRERCQVTTETNQTLQEEVARLTAENSAIQTKHIRMQERAIALEKSRAEALQANGYLESEVKRLTAMLRGVGGSTP